jgi:hypothetical protein
MGNGENELVINIEEDGINYIWTKKTYWKITTDFLWNVVNTIVDRIGSIVGNVLLCEFVTIPTQSYGNSRTYVCSHSTYMKEDNGVHSDTVLHTTSEGKI